jgi:hypothetical protein
MNLGIRISLLALTLWVALAHAQVFKWTDEDGKVHYGDRPPATANKKEVQVSPGPTPPPDALGNEQDRAERRRRLLDYYAERRAEKRVERERTRAQRQLNEARCLEARKRFAFYRDTNAIYEDLPNGERRYYSESERQQLFARFQRDIDELCD